MSTQQDTPDIARAARHPALRRLEGLAATTSLAAGGLFAALLLALHVVEPEFDPTWRFVSEYALGHAGWMMTLAFAALAVSLLSVAVAILPSIRTIPGYLGLVVIGIAALGYVLAASFHTDPITTSAHAATFSGQMHVLGAALDYSPVGMVLAGWSLSTSTGWRAQRRRLMLTSGITVLLTIVFIAALPRDAHFGPGVYAGLVGRVLLLSYLSWITVVGREVLNQSRSAEALRSVTGDRAT